MKLEHSPLGKRSVYINQYTADLLFPISRQIKRDEIGVPNPLPFYGYDLWNAFEISWLNENGKPIVAMAEIIIPAESKYIIESKSLKLYLNSFNQTHFQNEKIVAEFITKDLSNAVQFPVNIRFSLLDQNQPVYFEKLHGVCLDILDVQIDTYYPESSLLAIKDKKVIVSESLYSNLLKSNCLGTGQPDFASLQIDYVGPKMDHACLLKYIVSFRNHNEFHEQCVERIFMDILSRCQSTELTIYARYTRRGGLDINPYRSTNPHFKIHNPRLVRQ